MTKLSRRKIAPASIERRTLPYGFHLIEDDDVAAVDTALQADMALGLVDEADRAAVLDAVRSNLLTSGPRVEAFEKAFAETLGARHAVACTNGTSALHLALAGLDVGAGDVCIAPAITFLSTATAARFCGAEVQFADVDPISGLMTPQTLLEAIDRAGTSAKAVLPVHLAGRACDIAPIADICASRGLRLVEDACHALGTETPGGLVGSCRQSDAAAFSCHPVKMIACGEGGMVTTNSALLADRMRRLRNHGVTRDVGLMSDRELSFDEDGEANPWSYEQLELGFNYRMTEMAGALGLSQPL